MLIVCLLLICGGSIRTVFAMTMPTGTYQIEDAEALFEKFILEHHKSYDNEKQKQMRFEIFKTSLLQINEKNMKLEKPVYGITKFADLLPEELKKYKGFGMTHDKEPEKCEPVNLYEIAIGEAPESFDWRDKNVVTPIKDQNNCGSCWAFSTMANVESQYAIKYKKMIDLSEQQLVDCDLSCGRCNGGLMTNAMNYLKKNGAELEKDYSYVARDENCKYNRNLTKVAVTGCKEFTGANEDQLKEILYKYGPLSVAVSAETWNIYTGGILKECPSDSLMFPIDHAVLLVGYGSENGVPFWNIKNSWGEHAGEKGYVRIIRGQNACGILDGMVVTSFVA